MGQNFAFKFIIGQNFGFLRSKLVKIRLFQFIILVFKVKISQHLGLQVKILPSRSKLIHFLCFLSQNWSKFRVLRWNKNDCPNENVRQCWWRRRRRTSSVRWRRGRAPSTERAPASPATLTSSTVSSCSRWRSSGACWASTPRIWLIDSTAPSSSCTWSASTLK